MSVVDYICFSVPKIGETDYVVHEQDDNNTRIAKRRNMAMYKKAKENGIAIEYDRQRRCFFKDGKVFNVGGKNILPRATTPLMQARLINELDCCLAHSIQSSSDAEKIKHWPSYTQPAKRHIYEITFGDLIDNCDFYKDCFDVLHVKSVNGQKVNCTIFEYGYEVDPEDGEEYFYSYPELDLDRREKIFITEAFLRVADYENNLNNSDYRAFIINGKVVSLARALSSQNLEVPYEVKRFVKKQVEKNNYNPQFPKSYALDVAEVFIDGSRTVDVVNYGTIANAWLAQGNDLVEAVLRLNGERGVEKE